MMTRLILPFLVAFVVAVAGGSALVLVKAKDAHSAALDRYAELKAKADSAATAAPHGADSTKHDAAAPIGDSTATHGATPAPVADAAHAPPAAPVPVTVPPPGKPGATGAPMPTAPAKGASADPAATPVAAPTPPKDASPTAEAVGTEKKLAKIFAAMPPKEAAKVLQQMDDADVRVILGHLGPRQAASVLASFPPARAATLSQQQLKGAVARTASH